MKPLQPNFAVAPVTMTRATNHHHTLDITVQGHAIDIPYAIAHPYYTCAMTDYQHQTYHSLTWALTHHIITRAVTHHNHREDNSATHDT